MVARSIFHQLHLAHSLSHYLQPADMAMIHASVTSWLNYYNTLYTWPPLKRTRKQQLVQNAAPVCWQELASGNICCPIWICCPIMLHWLPVCFQIQLKVLVMIFKALHIFAVLSLSIWSCVPTAVIWQPSAGYPTTQGGPLGIDQSLFYCDSGSVEWVP